MKTRSAIHFTSWPKVAMRLGSPAIVARMPKNCIISPPPTQTTAIATWKNRRNSLHDIRIPPQPAFTSRAWRPS
jgi:hypothetical protein